MSYALLSSLYFGEATNADLSSPEARALLHVETPLDDFVPIQVAKGLDVVLTGNPGDGKSHLVRTLYDRRMLKDASVEFDLSARPTADVLRAWSVARKAGRPFVLCANEGPLIDLLKEMPRLPELAGHEQELRAQLGHAIVPRRDLVPASPGLVLLIDLADRNVLDEKLVEQALKRVCDHRFLPRAGTRSTETSAGRNLMLFAESSTARKRFAATLVRAGRRFDEHISFRQLWSAISYAITAAKKESTLAVELSLGKVGLGTFPLDHLVRAGGRGLLLEASRRFGDPALVTDPVLDESIWTTGQPPQGRWYFDAVPNEIPARLWTSGQREQALETHASLKRLVALAHEAGEPLVERLMSGVDLPQTKSDPSLLTLVLEGIRRLYLSPSEEVGAVDWLLSGLPLWIGHTYQDLPAEQRPHVAVTALADYGFELLRPIRVPWLGDALGPVPSVAWISHKESGITLRLDAELLAILELARHSSGPMSIPEPVQRFLCRLAGWEEANGETALGGDAFAVLSQPRGNLVTCAATRQLERGGFSYV